MHSPLVWTSQEVTQKRVPVHYISALLYTNQNDRGYRGTISSINVSFIRRAKRSFRNPLSQEKLLFCQKKARLFSRAERLTITVPVQILSCQGHLCFPFLSCWCNRPYFASDAALLQYALQQWPRRDVTIQQLLGLAGTTLFIQKSADELLSLARTTTNKFTSYL